MELVAHDLEGGGWLGGLAFESQGVELAARRPGTAGEDFAQSERLSTLDRELAALAPEEALVVELDLVRPLWEVLGRLV